MSNKKRPSYRLLSFHEQLLLLLYFLAIFNVAPPVQSFVLEPCVAASRQTPRRDDGLSRLHAAATNDDNLLEEAPHSFILPLFPLRKSIKLPGESLTLNLYEDRYLALATYVLQQQQKQQQAHAAPQQRACCFGALYTSDKPQIVTLGGQGPIVPMIQPGDVGVIFPVEHHQEDMILATATTTSGSEQQRRRIRLVGTAVARFCVQTILHDGHGGGQAVERDKQEALPFILAQVTLYTDNDDDDDDHDHDKDDNNALSTNTTTNLPQSPERIAWLTNRASLLGIPQTVMQDEFISFLQASAVYRDGVSAQRKALLASRSTQERMAQLAAASAGVTSNNNKGLFGNGR